MDNRKKTRVSANRVLYTLSINLGLMLTFPMGSSRTRIVHTVCASNQQNNWIPLCVFPFLVSLSLSRPLCMYVCVSVYDSVSFSAPLLIPLFLLALYALILTGSSIRPFAYASVVRLHITKPMAKMVNKHMSIIQNEIQNRYSRVLYANVRTQCKHLIHISMRYDKRERLTNVVTVLTVVKQINIYTKSSAGCSAFTLLPLFVALKLSVIWMVLSDRPKYENDIHSQQNDSNWIHFP